MKLLATKGLGATQAPWKFSGLDIRKCIFSHIMVLKMRQYIYIYIHIYIYFFFTDTSKRRVLLCTMNRTMNLTEVGNSTIVPVTNATDRYVPQLMPVTSADQGMNNTTRQTPKDNRTSGNTFYFFHCLEITIFFHLVKPWDNRIHKFHFITYVRHKISKCSLRGKIRLTEGLGFYVAFNS